MKISRTFQVDDAINQMFLSDRKEILSRAIESISKPYATRDLAEFIMSLD